MDGLKMKYFVLKPNGDDRYAEASRKAMIAYSLHIQNENKELANSLRDWVFNETRSS